MKNLWIDNDYEEQDKQDWFGDILEQHEVQPITDNVEKFLKQIKPL